MRNLLTTLLMTSVATIAALPQQQQQQQPQLGTDTSTTFQPIGNGFVGGVSVPAGTSPASSIIGNGIANNPGAASNNALTNGGGTAFNQVTGAAGGIGAPGGALPGQVDLANNAFAAAGGGRVGGAGPGVILPPGRSQVLPNQKFIVNSRMMIQVAEGALLCDAGGNAGFNGLQQGQQEFILRPGQMYRFRGTGVGGGLNQGFGLEACIAERPSIVLAEPY